MSETLDIPLEAIPLAKEPTTQLRDWLRAVKVNGLVLSEGGDFSTPFGVYAGGRPTDADPTCIVITRIGGAVVEPIDEGLYQFDIWAPTITFVNGLRDVLVMVLTGAPPGPIGGQIRFGGATVVSSNAVPDQDPSLQHLVVTAQVVTLRTADS